MGIAWGSSGQIQFTNAGIPAIAATAEFFEGGTTTPLATFTDMDEDTEHTDPVESDGNGRWPLVVIPYIASYDVKVSTAGGTEIYYFRELPNAEPFVAVDAPADEGLSTGDIIFSPKTGTRTGYVRVNGRTIGSATSGATERANADCEALFTFNWDNFADGICAVTGGRGANAAADWAANKRIALLDGRGATLRGVDDMGNSAASLLTLATFTTGNATTGGSIAGVNTHTLTTAQLAVHTHDGTTGNESDFHTHTGTVDSGGSHAHTVSGSTGNQSASHTHDTVVGNNDIDSIYQAAGATGATAAGNNTYTSGNQSADHTHPAGTLAADSGGAHTHTFSTGNQLANHSHEFTSDSTGDGDAHNNVSKSILGNLLQKL